MGQLGHTASRLSDSEIGVEKLTPSARWSFGTLFHILHVPIEVACHAYPKP